MKTISPFPLLKSSALAVVLLGALAACKPSAVNPPTVAPAAPAPAPATVYVDQPTVVVPEGLIYYPDYEVYYDPGVHVYWYLDGGRWVSGPRPGGISVDVLLHAPSARMDFRDSPENHHAQVVQRYPRGGTPPDRDRRGPP